MDRGSLKEFYEVLPFQKKINSYKKIKPQPYFDRNPKAVIPKNVNHLVNKVFTGIDEKLTKSLYQILPTESFELFSKVIEVNNDFFIFNFLMDKENMIFEKKKIFKRFVPVKMNLKNGDFISVQINSYDDKIEIKFNNCIDQEIPNLFKNSKNFSDLKNTVIFQSFKMPNDKNNI